jgi:hypothetical protein
MESLNHNELFIKLAGQAKGWYEHAFPDPDTFPPWSQLTSGMLSRFGPRYAAADAWASTCSVTRQEGESGLAALQRLDELQQASLLLGLPAHIGPIENSTRNSVTVTNCSDYSARRKSVSGARQPTHSRRCLMMLFALWRLRQRQLRLPPLAVSRWAHRFPSTSGTPGSNHALHIC